MDTGRIGRLAVAGAGVLLVTAVALPAPGNAQSNEELLRRIEGMERELDTLRGRVGDAETQAQETQQRVTAAERKASEPDRVYTKWHLAGYTDWSFIADDNGTEPDTTFSFGHFNPVFHFQYRDLVLFEGELELEVDDEGATELALEYAQADILVHDYVTFVAGKFLSPVGQFQERLHPTWVNKLPDAPVGFGHGGAQPLSDVGIQLRGGFPAGPATVTYVFAGGNGPRVGHHGPELEGFGEDDNDNKSFATRIGILPVPYFEVGGSFMIANARGEEAAAGPVTEGDYSLWGVDAAYTRGAWDVRVEYLNSELDSFFGAPSHGAAMTALIPKTDWEAWYAQIAYRLAGLTDMPILRNLEPVFRYGELDADGFDEFEEDNEERFNIGLNYLFAPSFIAKASVEWRDFEDPSAEDDTRFIAQLAYGF